MFGFGQALPITRSRQGRNRFCRLEKLGISLSGAVTVFTSIVQCTRMVYKLVPTTNPTNVPSSDGFDFINSRFAQQTSFNESIALTEWNFSIWRVLPYDSPLQLLRSSRQSFASIDKACLRWTCYRMEALSDLQPPCGTETRAEQNANEKNVRAGNEHCWSTKWKWGWIVIKSLANL